MAEDTVMCPLCLRTLPKGYLQSHHLMTRRKDRKTTDRICQDCHKHLHGLFSNTDLRDSRKGLDTLEGILGHPEFQKTLAFIKKIPPGSYMRMRQSNGNSNKRRHPRWA